MSVPRTAPAAAAGAGGAVPVGPASVPVAPASAPEVCRSARAALVLAVAACGGSDDTASTNANTDGELPPVDGEDSAAAAEGRIARFREQTRSERMAIADAAQARYGRKVSWGATLGERRELFAHLAVPVMTRLRQPQRQVLDTLVDAGVARSRSEALAWAVALVGQHTEAWLSELREKMAEVDKLRAQGPSL